MKIFRYTYWDSVLVIITLLELALKITWAFKAGDVPFYINVIMVALLSFLYFYNFIVVNHEFMHTPFFKSKKINNLYLVISSINLLYPMSLIKYGHNLHHIHNNDRQENGTTQDPTSTWLFGKNGKQESVITYALFGIFRQNSPSELKSLIPGTKKTSYGKYLSWEVGGIALVALIICTISWEWFVFGVCPSIYIGWVLTDTQNYFEHHRATNPDSRYTNSVSYYGKIYNFLWFNEGYHQEHHLVPNCHWQARPSLRHKHEAEFIKQGAYQASVPAMFGFSDKGVNQRK